LDPKHQQHGRGTSAREAGVRPLVLVIDDDEQFLRSCTRILEGWDYQVYTASDGRSAVSLVSEKSFDVILSDINVPGLTGLEVLRVVRQHDRDLPVVLMTGGPALESAREAVDGGALSYLIKPLSTAELKQVLERAVQNHQVARRERQILHSTEEHERALKELQAKFDRALEAMWMAFQPIVSWSRKTVVAYEALMRTRATELRSPLDILRAAEELNQIHVLGRTTRRRIADILRDHPELPGVFVNLHVLDLTDEDLYDPQVPLAAFSRRIHFEITERMAIEKIADLPARIAKLRELGYRIAVDDLGEGYSGLNSLAQLEPDAVKLDMSLIRGIDTTPTKRKMVHALSTLCRELETPLIAEGVETEAERDRLVELGADLFQGYLFARPDFPFPIPRM
jgi:EAL domain-containing protein (putative c-di-GMP-specific phosphodiesterase class I)